MLRPLLVRATIAARLLLLLLITLSLPAAATSSEDGYISRKADTWTLGTAKVERTITFSNGRFFTSSFKDRISGRELVPAGRVFEEIGGMVDGNEVSASGGASGWKLVSASDRKLASQEMQLDIVLRREALQVTKTYIVYPGASIIREWVQLGCN